MTEWLYVRGVLAFLLASAAFHLALPAQVSAALRRPVVVRAVGVCLLLLALPALRWRGAYFLVLFGALAASGAWRLCFPRHSIHAQEDSYPRRVHGWLLLAGAVAVWALHGL